MTEDMNLTTHVDQTNEIEIAAEKKKRGNFGNFRIKPDATLSIVFGTSEPIKPSEAMKLYWNYIKTHKLTCLLEK